ncbi:MAG: prolyl oligopeptidase family serine peptidase [Bacteroidales bacterium]
MIRSLTAFLILQLFIVNPAGAQTEKIPLTHDDYDSWKNISGQQISPDGRWVSYEVNPQKGDGMLILKDLHTGKADSVARGGRAVFSPRSGYLAFLVSPPESLVRQAKVDKKKDDEMPKDTLVIRLLDGSAMTHTDRVKSFKVAEEESGWMVWLHEKELPGGREEADSTDNGSDTLTITSDGTTLVIFNPLSGEKHEFPNVTGYSLSKNGALAAFIQNEKAEIPDREKDDAEETREETGEEGPSEEELSKTEEEKTTVWVFRTGTQTATRILEAQGTAKTITTDDEGRRAAFIFTSGDDHDPAGDNDPGSEPSDLPVNNSGESSNGTPGDKEPSIYNLWHWQDGSAAATPAVTTEAAGMPEGWSVSEHTSLSFTENGNRLYFGTAEKPLREPDDTLLAEEKHRVDIWHYKDPLIQPQQLAQRQRELRRTYTAVYHTEEKKMVQLARTDMPQVTTSREGDRNIEVGISTLPYQIRSSFESGSCSDIWLVDVMTGERRLVLEKYRGSSPGSSWSAEGLSPGGRYLLYYSQSDSNWYAMPAEGGTGRNLTASIPNPMYNELHDQPADPRQYGAAGWIEGDRYVLIYDHYDIWKVDPEGKEDPVNLTSGYGRANNLRFRYVSLDPDRDEIGRREEIMLSAFNEKNKQSGFYTVRVHRPSDPAKIIMDDVRFYTPRKAKEAGVLIWQKSTFSEFPDLWVSDENFSNARRISDANPQQSRYRWGTASLVEWVSFNHDSLQGILYKPENMDPGKKYPMIVYFYERSSDNLHRHSVPAPSRSTINMSYCVSNGYLVFVPDIPYIIGYPGQSAYNAVVSGTQAMLERYDFIDRGKTGVQGQSWGGYQIAWLITRTDLFRAAMAGAPVSNMFSAYGGIRWGSGVSRIFQYEETQSRIGGTIWEKPLRYLENSPLFFADRINTPLLMMHNDDDGAVPWYQGIEFFMALRRLGKPVWMLNYNDEAHNLTRRPNMMDLSVRMYQFFDHYLKGEPAPVWLKEGVPATEKGKTDGYELVE